MSPEQLRLLVADALHEKARPFLKSPDFVGIGLAEPEAGRFEAKIYFSDEAHDRAGIPPAWIVDIPGHGSVRIPVVVEYREAAILGH